MEILQELIFVTYFKESLCAATIIVKDWIELSELLLALTALPFPNFLLVLVGTSSIFFVEINCFLNIVFAVKPGVEFWLFLRSSNE